jgi:hypothetical protein
VVKGIGSGHGFVLDGINEIDRIELRPILTEFLRGQFRQD